MFCVVEYCKQNNLKAVYATTKRIVKEKNIEGKVVKISEFQHVKFRFYFNEKDY